MLQLPDQHQFSTAAQQVLRELQGLLVHRYMHAMQLGILKRFGMSGLQKLGKPQQALRSDLLGKVAAAKVAAAKVRNREARTHVRQLQLLLHQQPQPQPRSQTLQHRNGLQVHVQLGQRPRKAAARAVARGSAQLQLLLCSGAAATRWTRIIPGPNNLPSSPAVSS